VTAEPGDVLEIRILKMWPKKTGFNFNLPEKEFPTIGPGEGLPGRVVRYFDIDPKAKTIRFKPGIEIPLRPSQARSPSASTRTTVAAEGGARSRWAVSTLRPGRRLHMDINKMTEEPPSSSPVPQRRADLDRDSHCAQGTGGT